MRNLNVKVSSVLFQYDQDTPTDVWVVRPLRHGTQARTFLAYNPNAELGANLPSRIVVKLFEQRKYDVIYALNDEYQSLSLMGDSFRHLRVGDWKFSVPRPLFFTHDPPALVVSYVRGTRLEFLLRCTDKNTQIVLSTLHNPIASSLQKYWSEHFRIIGDLNYNNMLCDLPAKSLFFVDPGIAYPSMILKGTSKGFFPASHDLGYLLFAVCATNSMIELFSRARACRRILFVKKVINCYMLRFIEEPHFDRFLNELYECSKLHASEITLSWGLRGVWRRYVVTRVLSNLFEEIGDIRKQPGKSTRVGN